MNKIIVCDAMVLCHFEKFFPFYAGVLYKLLMITWRTSIDFLSCCCFIGMIIVVTVTVGYHPDDGVYSVFIR